MALFSRIGATIFAALALALMAGAADVPPNERVVLLVGLDGFRWDYLEKYHPPNLGRLAQEGVRAEHMTPCFPSLTFPNFYSLATGLRPEHHGIVANEMYDPEFRASFALGGPAVQEGRWWGGEPIWITAQKQGRKAACMFWPGSEAAIGGLRPSEWRPFDAKITPEARVQTVLEWLRRPAESRPQLITLYFHESDTAGHHFGPDAPETAAAVQKVDAALGPLLEALRSAELAPRANLVVVSDHGMTEIAPERVIALRPLLGARAGQIEFSGAVAGLRPPEGTEADVLTILKAQPHLRAYRREEIPESWHYRDNRRIPPIVAVADEGWLISRNPPPPAGTEERALFYKATHGFDPFLPSMQATFVAWGPACKSGVTIPAFENICVYPLLCSLLGITPAKCDGDGRLVSEVLK